MHEKQNIFTTFATMISLDRHISRLISAHDCVIIPGVGAFLAQRQSAYYNAEEQVYMPPRRTLAFNPHITIDDALLSTSYMEQYAISHKQASTLMNDDIKSLKRTLSRKGEIYFGELGKLSMNVNGVISFTPSEAGIDDPENHGMMPLPIPMLSHKKEKTITIPINRQRIAQYVAAAVAIIVMFVFVTPLSDHTFQNDIKASLGSFASPEQISMMQQVGAPAPATTSGKACEIQPIEQINASEATTAITTATEEGVTSSVTETAQEAENSKQETAPQASYHIIVASTPNPEKAQLAITELSAKAEFEYSIVECNGRFRIAASSYPTQQEAQAALASIQQTFSDAWIFMR